MEKIDIEKADDELLCSAWLEVSTWRWDYFLSAFVSNNRDRWSAVLVLQMIRILRPLKHKLSSSQFRGLFYKPIDPTASLGDR